MKVLCFHLGGQEYATDVTQVREVLDLVPITHIPHTPAFVLGVINLRGQIIAVIDLRRFFDLPETAVVNGGKIMILSLRNKALGALADHISQVRALELSELESPPAMLGRAEAEFMKGVKQMGDHPLVYLDLARILESPQMKALQEA
ncbi:MAG: chemotaxis protein CheW [Nitrospirae bacterium]|nr:chemotaxis protein CheW [Nitrospirota bacterium]